MSDLIQYNASVAVTDSRLNDSNSNVVNIFDISVLAVDKTDATSLITQFYSVSGLATKTINGVPTIFRSSQSKLPGAIRQVNVLSLYQTPVASTPPEVQKTVQKTVQKVAAKKEVKEVAVVEPTKEDVKTEG